MADAATAPAPVAAATAAVAPTKRRKLPESRMNIAEALRTRHVVVPEAGTDFAELADPLYWAHVARKLRPGDMLEIHPEDGGYFAELIVRAVEGNGRGAKVAALRHVKLDAVANSAEDYRVEWKGQMQKHAVVRVRDKEVMQGGFGTKDEAMAWLAANGKSLA